MVPLGVVYFDINIYPTNETTVKSEVFLCILELSYTNPKRERGT